MQHISLTLNTTDCPTGFLYLYVFMGASFLIGLIVFSFIDVMKEKPKIYVKLSEIFSDEKKETKILLIFLLSFCLLCLIIWRRDEYVRPREWATLYMNYLYENQNNIVDIGEYDIDEYKSKKIILKDENGEYYVEFSDIVIVVNETESKEDSYKIERIGKYKWNIEIPKNKG